MSVNDACVSISTGTLSPDLRVNYAYGMVLGLGEFLQEQRYLIEKDHLHERALHGFGTAYGLEVTVAPVETADYTVTVAPGLCIDQWGREVVVRTPQCARLGAWLAAQEQANPGAVTANRDPSGGLTVYVVASYAECPDDLVPLPGQPCSSSAQTKVASRLRDSWDIQLRWAPPAMPQWDTDRRLARLLSAVQIVAGLDPTQSSEDDIIAAVLALPDEVGSGSPPPGPAVYRLPAETAADALDRIFTVWVTRVRPLLAPDLTQPPDSSDPAVLLASITFTLGTGGGTGGATPPITSCDDPDDHGRPYLLHTRLIQELRTLALSGTTTRISGRELATLTAAADGKGQLTLTAWFHLDAPVALTAPVKVVTRSGVSAIFSPTPVGGPGGGPPQFANVWTLIAQGNVPAIDGDQVAVSFVASSVLVGDASTTLAARMGQQGLELVDTGPAGDVVVYGTVDVPTAAVRSEAPPTLEFVTITPLTPANEKIVCELWFHPQPQWPKPRAVIADVKEGVTLIEEQNGQTITLIDAQLLFDNVWQLEFAPAKVVQNLHLRFVFLASRVSVTVDGKRMTLPAWMKAAGITFLNQDPSQETITAYCRVAGAQ